jgi:hypothetical protein
MLFKKTEKKLLIKIVYEQIFTFIIPLVDKLPPTTNKKRRKKERRTATERSRTADYIKAL